MKHFPLLILLLLLFPAITYAATISGNTYDFSLNKLKDVSVEINTVPRQLIIAKDGSYSFSVPKGYYTLKATYMRNNLLIASVAENITIADDGAYTLDLILFPNIDEDLLEEADIEPVNLNDRSYAPAIIVAVIVILLAIAAGLYLYRKKSKPAPAAPPPAQEIEGEDDTDKVLTILKKEGSRATQKEIRKQMPLSEAKVSLIIAQLEHEGRITKIN